MIQVPLQSLHFYNIFFCLSGIHVRSIFLETGIPVNSPISFISIYFSEVIVRTATSDSIITDSIQNKYVPDF